MVSREEIVKYFITVLFPRMGTQQDQVSLIASVSQETEICGSLV